jgi:hypothetical protein
MFNFLCFNSGNSENELEGDCISVCEEKKTIVAIDLMDGCTILCIQDVGASLMNDLSYHFGGWEMESHIFHNENLEVNPFYVAFVLREFGQKRKMLENLYF